MIRRRHGVSLSRAVQVEEDINPNAYIVNIADCMLVLLLGMVMALITYYNIDLTQTKPEEIIGIQVNMDENQDGDVDSSYQRSGTVYYDSATDSYYFVNEGEA